MVREESQAHSFVFGESEGKNNEKFKNFVSQSFCSFLEGIMNAKKSEKKEEEDEKEFV